MAHGQAYTDEEDRILYNLLVVQKRNYAFVSDRLGRTPKSLQGRMAVLRQRAAGEEPKRPKRYWNYWTEAEAAIIEAAGPTARPVDLMDKLPGRSADSIEQRQLRQFGKKPRTRPVAADEQLFAFPQERPLGVPFISASGIKAIRLASGVVPYVSILHSQFDSAVPSSLPPTLGAAP